MYQKPRNACFHILRDSDRVCRLFLRPRSDFNFRLRSGARKTSHCRTSFFCGQHVRSQVPSRGLSETWRSSTFQLTFRYYSRPKSILAIAPVPARRYLLCAHDSRLFNTKGAEPNLFLLVESGPSSSRRPYQACGPSLTQSVWRY